MRTFIIKTITAVSVLAASGQVFAQGKKYDPGATDSEIKLGQTIIYSGPLSHFGISGRVFVAYFTMVNEKGGINGRKINVLSLDDAYSPPKTVEVTRRLVEEEKVLAMTGSQCVPCQTAVRKYLNASKVPQLFGLGSSEELEDYKTSPWTVPLAFAYAIEAEIYGNYILKTKPDAKIGVLSANDDVGKAMLKGLKKGLGSRASTMIVKEATYETTDASIDPQVLLLRSSGADTFANFTAAKFASQSIRKVATLDWKPLQIIPTFSSAVGGVLTPAGLDNSKDIITAGFLKTPGDPAWDNDKGMMDFLALMKKYLPNENPDQFSAVLAYNSAAMTANLLERAGDNLTRDNLLALAQSIKDYELPLTLPGIKVNITPTNHQPFTQARLSRFDGVKWVPFTPVVGVDPAPSR